MGRARTADITGWSLIAFWLLVSACAIGIGNWAFFQSAGALGICAGVIYFIVQRHADPYPHGAIESQTMQIRQVQTATDAALVANANVSLLAKILVEKAQASGETVSSSLAALGSVPMEDIERQLASRVGDWTSRIDAVETQSLMANASVNAARRKSEIWQAVVVVVGTLQGGFGGYVPLLLGSRTRA